MAIAPRNRVRPLLTPTRVPAVLVIALAVASASIAVVASVAVPVKVFSDVASIESQNCCTYEISATGARLVTPPGIKSVGQTIWVQRQNRRARYRVAWIGQPGTSLEGQVGVESLEPANVIWEPEIKARIMRS